MPELSKRRRQIHPLRDALLAGICTFIVSAVGLAILYLKAYDAQVAGVRLELLQLARATAAQIDGDLLKTLVSPDQDGSPEHLRALEPIVRMHRATHDIYYTYTGVYREGRIYWVLDGAKVYRVPGNDLAPDPIMTLYKVRDADYEAAFRDGVEYIDPEPRPYADGHKYLSAAAPIRDTGGKLVGMFGLDMVTDKLDERVAAIRRMLYLALAVVTLLSIGAGAVAHQLRKFAAALVEKMRKARAEAELNAANAEAANRAKATFLAMMSHEIRTPMNGMLGVADLLRNMSPDAAQKRLLDILSNSGESLLRIINDILDFSKIEAEKLELRPKPFEVRGLLEELTALLSTQASGKQISFVLDADPQLPAAVVGDRQRLSQVLLNLGNNAVKFTDHGEVRLIVRLHGSAHGKATLRVHGTRHWHRHVRRGDDATLHAVHPARRDASASRQRYRPGSRDFAEAGQAHGRRHQRRQRARPRLVIQLRHRPPAGRDQCVLRHSQGSQGREPLDPRGGRQPGEPDHHPGHAQAARTRSPGRGEWTRGAGRAGPGRLRPRAHGLQHAGDGRPGGHAAAARGNSAPCATRTCRWSPSPPTRWMVTAKPVLPPA